MQTTESTKCSQQKTGLPCSLWMEAQKVKFIPQKNPLGTASTLKSIPPIPHVQAGLKKITLIS